MEYGSRLRFALLAIGGILLLVLSIWGISTLAHHLISSGPDTTTSKVKKINVADYNKESSFVRLTISGPVVASEKYESYQIEVGQNYRDIKIFKGYDQEVVTEQRYSNDSVAYDSFLKSLRQKEFTTKSSVYGSDEKGYCAEGNRYVYEIYDHSDLVQRTWNTSCDVSIGTFKGLGSSVRSLFKKQIPDFSKLTEKISI